MMSKVQVETAQFLLDRLSEATAEVAQGYALVSIANSLERIADSLEVLTSDRGE